ncbi:MAG: SnoaL-like domain-containing protein [Lachnospiraceae bacterium]|nr:SnoaL-like domain-containing protein [Lachnospiraceae bacterium]MCI9658567.1 SnoaL-like domain-containing protein [Lachnospiraceae bacterium]
MEYTIEDIRSLSEEEFEELERRVEKLLSVWAVKNLRGQAAAFHDDQHIGEKRRELKALKHPGFDAAAEMAFRRKAVVDSLEGNSLIHPLTTPVIEVNEDCTKARAVWWSLGVEGLSRFREQPMALISLGMVPGTHVKEDGEWRILSGAWQRTTKNEYHKGWVHSMEPTNTRPPLTPEEDRNFLGKYAYQKDEVRKPVPEPPHKDTWESFPDEMDDGWMYINL